MDPTTTPERPRPVVLVTGAQSRLGRVLLPQLVAHGYDVRALTSRPEHPADDARTEWRTADLRSDADLHSHVRGCRAIVHLAATQPGPADPMPVNRDATIALARCGEAAGVDLFCFVSSISVLGTPTTPTADEDSPMLTPDADRPEEYWERPELRAYARSKAQAELGLRGIARRSEYVVLRPTVIVDRAHVLGALTMSAVQRAVAWYQATHWVAVDDVAAAVLWALDEGLAAAPARGRIQTFTVSDEAVPHRYGDLFRSAGQVIGRWHGVPLPPVPASAWLLVKRAQRGFPRPPRLPSGFVRFPAARLAAAGWTPSLGVRAVVDRAVRAGDRPGGRELLGAEAEAR